MSSWGDSDELGRSFRRGFATTFSVDLITKVFGAATVLVLIRGLSISTYAYTTLFFTLAQFAGGAAGGGVRTRYLREEAERISRGGGAFDREEAFLTALFKGTVLIVGIGVAALPVARAVGLGAKFGGATSLVAYATAFAVGFSAAELAIVRYQARRRFAAAGAVSVARAAALLGASLMILLTGGNVVLLSLWLVASMALVGVIAAGPIVWRALLAPSRRSPASWFTREEVWLSLYYAAAAGFAYVDVMVAGALLSEHQLATLGASLRYLAIVQSPIPALGAILRVRTSQFDLIDSPANQRAMVLTWLRRTTLPAGLLMAVVIALSPVIIPHIDGGKYPGSVAALQIFLITAFSAYLTAPAVSILMAQRRFFFLAWIYALSLLLNLAGDVVVARRYGVLGIAVVSTALYVATDLVLTFRALRHASGTKRTVSVDG
jgi:O-antigen/teichoic acid export membrane protein